MGRLRGLADVTRLRRAPLWALSAQQGAENALFHPSTKQRTVRGDDLKHDAMFSYVWLVTRRMRTR